MCMIFKLSCLHWQCQWTMKLTITDTGSGLNGRSEAQLFTPFTSGQADSVESNAVPQAAHPPTPSQSIVAVNGALPNIAMIT